jgi:HlyD family secretion protein
MTATQARLALANAESDKCTLRAPTDIIELRNLVEVGDSINPLNPSAQSAAITVVDLSRLRVRAEVDERDIRYVKLGQRVNIISEFDQSLKLTGSVARIEAEMGQTHH